MFFWQNQKNVKDFEKKVIQELRSLKNKSEEDSTEKKRKISSFFINKAENILRLFFASSLFHYLPSFSFLLLK